jgi:hypothetical protein
LLIRSFIRAYLFINIRSLMLFIRVFRDIIKNYLSILDCIGALDRIV